MTPLPPPEPPLKRGMSCPSRSEQYPQVLVLPLGPLTSFFNPLAIVHLSHPVIPTVPAVHNLHHAIQMSKY